MRCKMISNAGTARMAFQYIGLIPQIKNAEDAYTTPNIASEWRWGFVFWGLRNVIGDNPAPKWFEEVQL